MLSALNPYPEEHEMAYHIIILHFNIYDNILSFQTLLYD